MIYKFSNSWSKRDEFLENVKNRPIWAFAYKEDDRARNLNCEPVLGEVKNGFFYQYKKNEEGFVKKPVQFNSRYYADTYEEAVKGFNDIIDEMIEKRKNQIGELEKKKLWVEDVVRLPAQWRILEERSKKLRGEKND